MTNALTRHRQLEEALKTLQLPTDIQISCWSEADFPAIQHLSTLEGWSTPQNRPEETLSAWQHSWPTLIATRAQSIIGFVREITDEAVTTYIAELLVEGSAHPQLKTIREGVDALTSGRWFNWLVLAGRSLPHFPVSSKGEARSR